MGLQEGFLEEVGTAAREGGLCKWGKDLSWWAHICLGGLINGPTFKLGLAGAYPPSPCFFFFFFGYLGYPLFEISYMCDRLSDYSLNLLIFRIFLLEFTKLANQICLIGVTFFGPQKFSKTKIFWNPFQKVKSFKFTWRVEFYKFWRQKIQKNFLKEQGLRGSYN